MKKIRTLFCAMLLCLMLAVPALAKTVTITFSFDPNAEASITGFRLYETDTPGTYLSPPIMTITPTGRVFTFTIPDTDACYAWTIVGYNDVYGTEGLRSNEATACITGGVPVFPTPTTAPQILNIQIVD